MKALYECPTTEEAMRLVRKEGLDFLWTILARIAAKRCEERAFEDIKTAVAFIDNGGIILGATDDAPSFAEEIKDGK